MRNEPCAVTADLNRYLAKLDEDDARSAIVEQRAEELVAGEYSPGDYHNIVEALGEMSDETFQLIAEGINTASSAASPIERNIAYHVIGEKIHAHVREYWQASAKKIATESVDNAECHRCYDQGCPSCDPPEPDYDY